MFNCMHKKIQKKQIQAMKKVDIKADWFRPLHSSRHMNE